MRTHQGSIRDLLQRALLITAPRGVHPFSNRWRFHRDRHSIEVRRYAERLRDVGQEMIDWLDESPSHAD